MKRRRVLVLTHSDLIPPQSRDGLSEKEMQPWKTEYDVVDGLQALGHEVQIVGVSDDLTPIRGTVQAWRPDVVFNLLVEFRDVGAFQIHVASYLELLGVAYTGCNPRGMLMARDKGLSKKVLRYHRISTPAFAVVPRGRRPRGLRRMRYPMIVKSVEEEASLGLSQASVVDDESRLRERVAFVHENVETDAIVEEYISGRELTIGLIGNDRLRTFPVWEMFFDKLPDGTAPIATAKVKWDLAYQERLGIDTGLARELDTETSARISRLARRIYRVLELSGFARIDLRLAEDGRVFVIEANSNPDLAADEDFARSAEASGLSYPQLLQRVLNLGLRYRPPWGHL